MQKRFALVGLAAGLTVGSVAGVTLGAPSLVSAQTATDATTETTAPGPATTEGSADRAWFAEALAPLVADGTLSQAQADAAVEALEDARPERGPFGGHRGWGLWHRLGLDAAAEALELSSDDLRAALRDGQTLAELAVANGVGTQAVIDALVADHAATVAERVASGDMTQEEANEKLALLAERVAAIVDDGAPASGWGQGGLGGPRRGSVG